MKQRIKLVLGPVILLATVALFAYFLAHHPETVATLRHLPPSTIVWLLLLYAVMFMTTVLITRGTLLLFTKSMGRQENLLFNAYSSLINFFGPGQSGPIFRGAYLNKRHGLGVKQYVFASLLIYGLFAIGSVLLLLLGSRPWWQAVLLMGLVGGASLTVIRGYQRRSQLAGSELQWRAIGLFVVVTVVQLVAMCCIYGLELTRVGAHASIGQVLTYTGVANLALFVALTPAAIGIRESFLVLSQQLHHLPSGVIVAANVVDRAAYVLFLGVLFGVVLGLHAKDKLNLK